VSHWIPGIVAKETPPEAHYHWKTDEGIAEGLRRIVSEQLQSAIWNLSKNGSLDVAVHEARKSVKKIRSAMRLARHLMGPAYEVENKVLRDVGRELSPLRDAAALIEMFDDQNGKYREQLGDRSLISVRDGLVARKNKLSSSFERKHMAGEVLRVLRKVAARVRKWDLSEGDFQVLSTGFASTVRQNRKARDEAYADAGPESFHDWRKRAKDLRYHLALLHKAWPPVLEGYLDAAADLEQQLGDDHNLVVLRDTILKRPDDFGEAKDISSLMNIIAQRQQDLRSKARSMAVRLYGEKPRHWRKRLEISWTL